MFYSCAKGLEVNLCKGRYCEEQQAAGMDSWSGNLLVHLGYLASLTITTFSLPCCCPIRFLSSFSYCSLAFRRSLRCAAGPHPHPAGSLCAALPPAPSSPLLPFPSPSSPSPASLPVQGGGTGPALRPLLPSGQELRPRLRWGRRALPSRGRHGGAPVRRRPPFGGKALPNVKTFRRK